MPERDKPLTVYLSAELLERIERMARAEKRKRAPMVAILVEEAFIARQQKAARKEKVA